MSGGRRRRSPRKSWRRCRREGERVVAAAVEPGAVGVAGGERVLGADSDAGVGHGGGDAGADVAHHRPGVEQPGAVAEELVAAADERRRPCAVGVVVDVGVAWREHEAAHDPGLDPCRLVEDRAHPLVGCERSAGGDPDRGELSGTLGVERFGGLIGDDRRDLLEEREVVAVNAVERGMREVQELRLRWVAGAPERVDARARQVLHAAERADDQPVRVRRRPGDEVAIGDLAVVIGRQDQVLPP